MLINNGDDSERLLREVEKDIKNLESSLSSAGSKPVMLEG